MTPHRYTDFNRIEKAFSRMPDWEERYRLLIDLGRKLPPFPDELKTETHRVEGCVSNVWLVAKTENGTLHLWADSDAHIVKGLVAILLSAYSGKPLADIRSLAPEDIFTRLGLEGHITPNRRSGFMAMVQRVQALAA